MHSSSYYDTGLRDCYVYLDYSCSSAEFRSYKHINGNYYFDSDFLISLIGDTNNEREHDSRHLAIGNYLKVIQHADCMFTPVYEPKVILNEFESNFDLEESALQNSGIVEYTHESYTSPQWNDVSHPNSYLHDCFCRLDMLLSSALPFIKGSERL